MNNRLIRNLLFLSGIAVIFFISLNTFRGPAPVKSEDSAHEFSAYRALEHDKIIAKEPHSMGTKAHEEVRNYIFGYLTEMGLETSIQQTTVVDNRRTPRAASVYNIVGILRGTSNSKAVMIISHYDSTPHTLGAADDGAGLSAMLETIRVIKGDGNLKNDIIFLFTDGEESGLFGAKAFVKENKLAAEVGLVLNLEARGSSGPVFTYEVSPGNGWIMREYYKAVRYPVASSLAYEVYRMMPNSSDFTVFKEAGMSGFNTAFLDDFVNYHSMNDSPGNLSLRSLQHLGSYAVDIIRHFGNKELNDPHLPDLLYFNILGRLSVHFPQNLSLPLLILSVFLFLVFLALGLKKKELKPFNILLGVLVFVLSLALSLGVIWLINKAVLIKYPVYSVYYSSNFYNENYYLMAYLAISLAVFSLVYALVFKKMGIVNLAAGILLVSVFCMFALYFYVPTAIYVGMLPLMLLSIAFIVNFWFGLDLKNKQPWFLLVNLLVLIPVIGFYLPMVKVLFITFSLEFPIAGIALWLILLGFLIIPVRVFFEFNRWVLSILALVFGMIFLAGAHLHSQTDEKQPLQSSIFYALNHETDTALWVSNVLAPDEWNKQFFNEYQVGPLTEIFPFASLERLKNKAQWVSLNQPEIEMLSDSILGNDNRRFHFNIKSSIGAENFQLYIPANAKLKLLEVNDKKVDNPSFYSEPVSGFHILNYFGWQKEGVDFTIECASTLPVEILVFEKKLGLPAGLEFVPMPKSVIPQTGYESFMSLVRTKFVL